MAEPPRSYGATDAPVCVRMDPAAPPVPGPAHAENPSQCSIYLCPTAGSSAGILADIGTVAAAAIAAATGSAIPVYFAIGFGSISGCVHAGEGIWGCKVAPQKSLERTVELTGDKAEVVAGENKDLRSLVATLRQNIDQLQGQLAAQNETIKELKQELQTKVKEVLGVAEKLEVVNKRFEESQGLLRGWEQATAQVAEQLPSLHPDRLEADMAGITRQMEQLSLSERGFSDQMDKLGADVVVVSQTRAVWSRMIEQLQGTLKGLATDNVQKKELLACAQKESQRLSDTVGSLQREIAELKPKVEKADQEAAELRKMNEELEVLQGLLKRPDIAERLQSILKPANQ